MKIEARKNIVEGFLIGAGAYMALFVIQVAIAPSTMQRGMQEKVEAGEHLAVSENEKTTSCNKDLSVQVDKSKLLQDQRDNQQQTINSDQNQLNVAQGTISACVVNEAKMNPRIMQSISVVAIPLADFDNKGRIGSLAPFISPRHLWELLIITNIRQNPPFKGILRCENSFDLISEPKMQGTGSMMHQSGPQPRQTSDKEQELRIFDMDAIWAPVRPVYLQVITSDKDIGKCSFEPKD